jgi:Lon protease-like protein
MSDELSPLADFAGVARLFPLPNLVLFPHVMQPLHIFEPRYRQMTADALAGDRLIAMALLKPGWEADYDGSPAIYPVACLGKVVAEQRLDDGRYNLLLRGLSRVRILDEPKHDRLYRLARVDVLDEVPLENDSQKRELRRRLGVAVTSWFPTQGAVLEQFRKLLASDLALGPLADIIAFALPLDLKVKQALLEDVEVQRRVRRLLKYLEKHAPAPEAPAPDRQFPPEFSAN